MGGIDARIQMRMYASAEVLIVRGVSARRDARRAENREVRSLICVPPAPPVWLAGWLAVRLEAPFHVMIDSLAVRSILVDVILCVCGAARK